MKSIRAYFFALVLIFFSNYVDKQTKQTKTLFTICKNDIF